MRRFSRYPIVFASVLCIAYLPYLLYQKILGKNQDAASISSFASFYPSEIDMAANLMCLDPDDTDAPPVYLAPGPAVTPGDNFTASTSSFSSSFSFQPPFYTSGRHILDSKGTPVKLISINWYGGSDREFVPGGLDVRHRNDIARTIRMMGFNSVRLPYSDEMVKRNPVIPEQLWAANKDLLEFPSQRGNSPDTITALTVFDAVIEALTSEGIMVIVNNHITTSRWCCDANLCDATWSNTYLGPVCRNRQTESQWINNWLTVMGPHILNPLVIGVDLRNEVRSPLGSSIWPMWATAAEKAAKALSTLQPDWLIFVEGTNSANYLQGARHRPIQLTIPRKLVYSVHIYGWSGWGSLTEGSYWQRSYAAFAADMYENWAWIVDEDVAPVWVGEIGAPDNPKTGDLNYWRNLVEFLGEVDVGFAYWAINPRKPMDDPEMREEEHYSLLKDDWKTPKCDYRLWDLATLAESAVEESELE